MSHDDGETDAFYQWVIDQAQKCGDVQNEREARLPLRARAYGAAAFLNGAESCERDAPPPHHMSGAGLFKLLRETWAAGYRAGRG